MATYQLRCQIFGHEKDVRAVTPAIIPDSAIISGSRDVTARVWVPEEGSTGFHEGHCMSGHSNFVASVCCLPPDDKYPHGLIFTGSNDNSIKAYSLDSPTALFTLTGHEGTVCSMAAGRFGTLLSGSWDKTAKVWLNEKCVMTLEGHQSAVWAVAIMPEQGVMLTGSADKTIKVWKAGKCENTIKGHDDCVRGLAVTQGSEFLSCSNDATIRRWLLSGDCLNVYYGHENFVYAMAVLPNGVDFVSCGEDRTVRVWQDGKCKQTINHPTLSVWTVCVLANGDIVSGSGDGVIRVFTSDQTRFASTEELKAYDDQIAASQVPSDIRPEDLPGPEALDKPGGKEGQTKMVRTAGGKVELYSWDQTVEQWKKVGDVVGSSGGTNATSGKTLYEGKEYDYVFTVDIEEGKPPLKLPYNLSEDPWFAAQKFLQKNNLSQLFLDQVANFITDNTKGATLSQGTPSDFVDPFTGGGRYVPGSDQSSTDVGGSDPFTGGGRYVPGAGGLAQTGGGGADPFTGGGRYVPSYTDNQQRSSGGGGGDVFAGAYTTGTVNANLDKTNDYFPKTVLVTFDAANPAQIMGKLKEFNAGLDPGQKVDEAQLSPLEQVMKGSPASKDHLQLIKTLIEWPPTCVFPALDVLRIVIKQQDPNAAFSANDSLLEKMMTYWSHDMAAANQILSLKVVSNMFGQPAGYKLCMDNRERILNAAIGLTTSQVKNKNIQISLATLIMNFSVGLFGSLDLEGKTQTFNSAVELLKEKPDPEAAFRLFIAMGTLIHKDEMVLSLAQSMGVQPMLSDYVRLLEPKKVADCANLLNELLR